MRAIETASANGFILGLIGGLLDFASGSLILVGGMGMMGDIGAASVTWAAGLFLLGVAVVVTSVLSVQYVGIRLRRLFSVLMVVYGVIMVLVGLSMTSGYAPSEGVSFIFSYGMVLVGGAMMVNGVMMQRSPASM